MLYITSLLFATVAVSFLLLRRPRRRPGEPFDWTHRRRWWKPHWAFPDDR